VKAIVRRLARLEDRYVPREDAESERLRERLRRARERMQAMGHELPSPLVYDGPPSSLGERILLARRHPMPRLAMAEGQKNLGTKCAT
jgi:hypothetical protein